jgi:hypothetical protein
LDPKRGPLEGAALRALENLPLDFDWLAEVSQREHVDRTHLGGAYPLRLGFSGRA